MLKFTNISKTLLYLGRFTLLLRPLFKQFLTLAVIIMFIIYSKERRTAVTHTHNTEINYLYTRLLSYINTFTQEKKT